MKIIVILFISLLNGQNLLDYLSGPITMKIGLINGYDDNVLHFSDIEKSQASTNKYIMGGANTFDSHFTRYFVTADKRIHLADRSKYIHFYTRTNISNYSHNDNRHHWSGNLKTTYRWGPYRKIAYSLRHLNSYYTRHYIDRDISNYILQPCNFTDREQYIEFSYPIKRDQWMSILLSYNQRYYDIPFIEFDLDILSSSLKINRRVRNVGSIAIVLNLGTANNLTFGKTAKAGLLDRSYKNFEWYVPFTYGRGIGVLDKVGFSMRQDFRYYKAEEEGDQLHSGRNHIDNKMNIWAEKKINAKLLVKASLRYRFRLTESQFDWVSKLRTFHQWQAWISIEWKMVYDRY